MAALQHVELKSLKGKTVYGTIFGLLMIGIPLQIFPYLWMLSGTLKTNREIMRPMPSLIPDNWLWENIPNTISTYNLWHNLYNTFILTGGTILIQCTISVLAAYSLSKLKPKGAKWVLLFFVGTMMISEQALAIPTFLMFHNFFGLGSLINSFWSLLLAFSAWGWAIFLLKSFFDGLPNELMEAARVDGAGAMQMLGKIIMPLSKPVLAVVILNTFMAVYNQFMFPLVLLPDSSKWTVIIRIYAMQRGRATWVEIMVLLTFATIPVMAVFVLAQKYIVQGIALTGLKG